MTDIALMKLEKKKFGKEYSLKHLIKALSYFLDAEKEPPQKMLKKIRWEEVKSFFVFQSAVLAKKYMF